MKYSAGEFKVTIIWFTEKGIGKRNFRKYKDAVAWAERNLTLTTSEIAVRITGTLSLEEENVGSNNIMPTWNGG